ncbi:MAG TPA: hypothetical protein ENK63_02320 [Rhodobacterales bacterium]|nr:hypothetical protein [Rhodobacterales bacterium]
MRRFLSALSLVFIVPLAACFDVDMSVNVVDDNTAEATMVMTASPEFYAMMTSSGEAFCEGEETALDDGSHTCTETFSGSIDEVLDNPDMGEGMTFERRDGGLVFISFDLGDLSDEVTPPAEAGGDDEDMRQMMRAAFVGHHIKLSISGAEIVETNGTLSDDGKTAQLVIPLEGLMDETSDLPAGFDVLLKPGT